MSTAITEAQNPGAVAPPHHRYWAFISYSHRDERWATWLHRSLEAYRLPRPLVGTPTPDGIPRPRRLFPLFRDRDELAGAPDLGEKIQAALRESRNLIVVCSPHAAGSEWVNQEIAAFKASGRADRVFCLIVEGEPNASERSDGAPRECFPQAIRFQVLPDGAISALRAEPLAADARPEGDGRRNALLKLLAGILDVGYDALRQREQERRIRRLAAAGTVLTAAVLVLAGLTYYAFLQKGAAEREARASRAALSAQLATHSRLALETIPPRGLLLAVEAVQTTRQRGEPLIPAAETALRAALAYAGGRVFGSADEPVTAAELGPDGRWLFIADSSGGARLADLSRPERPAVALPGAGPVAAMSADGRWLATAGRDGRDGVDTRLWDLSADSAAPRPLILAGAAAPLVFTPDRRWLVTGGAPHRRVRLWDLSGIGPDARAIVLRSQTSPVVVASVSPDSRWLVTSSWDPEPHSVEPDTAWLWDLSSADPAARPRPLGAPASISHAVFTRDGRWLATASAQSDLHTFRFDSTVYLWDLARPEPSREPLRLAGHSESITALAASADARWLASGSSDGTVRVWDLAAPDPRAAVRVLGGHEGSVEGLALGPDGRWLVSGTIVGWRSPPGAEGRARIWFLAGEPAPTPVLLQNAERPVEVSSFATSHDGRQVLVGSPEGAFVLDLTSEPGDAYRILRGHEDAVAGGSFSADGRTVVTRSADGTARVWSLQTAGPSADPLILPNGRDEWPMVSPDGRWLHTVGDPTGAADDAMLWDLAAADPTARPTLLRGHQGPLFAAAFSPDGHWLATGGNDATARLWPLPPRGTAPEGVVLRGHSGVVADVAFSPDGGSLVTASFDGTAVVWDLTSNGAPSASRRVQADDALYAAAFAGSGRWVVLRGGANVVPFLWDPLAFDSARERVPLLTARAETLVSPDGQWVAVFGNPDEVALARQMEELQQNAPPYDDAAGRDRYSRQLLELDQRRQRAVPVVELWSLGDAGAPSRRILPGAGPPRAFSPDSRLLLTEGLDSLPRLWQLFDGGADTAIALRSDDQIRSMTAVFSPDGRWLSIGSFGAERGTGRLWELDDASSPRGSRILATDRVSVSAGAFSPDGRRLLLISNADNVAGLHPVSLDSTAQSVILPTGDVTDGFFTPDGRRLVTTDSDRGTLSAWELDLERLLHLACRSAGRNLTRDEWRQYFPSQPYHATCPGYPPP